MRAYAPSYLPDLARLASWRSRFYDVTASPLFAFGVVVTVVHGTVWDTPRFVMLALYAAGLVSAAPRWRVHRTIEQAHTPDAAFNAAAYKRADIRVAQRARSQRAAALREPRVAQVRGWLAVEGDLSLGELATRLHCSRPYARTLKMLAQAHARR